MLNVRNILIRSWAFLFSLLLLTADFGCNGPGVANKPTDGLVSKQPATEIVETPSLHVNDIPLGYDNLKFVGGLEANFKSDEEINCNNWKLNVKNIEGILSKMKKVSGVEWGAKCYKYPCAYSGKAANENLEYKVSINAAANILLSRNDEILYFISDTESPSFMQPCDCCE